MSIAVFGSKVFTVNADKIYTPSELQYSTGLDTEKQEAAGKKPSTYNKGPGLNTLNMKLALKADFGVNPRREIEDWEAIKDAGVAHQFILGSRPLGKNKWLLVDAQARNMMIDNTGVVLEAELSLSFDEYVRSGSSAASAAAASSSTGGKDIS
ncbi:MAG: phage tail protein, partial [bacterium]